MSLSALTIVLAERVYEFIGQIDGLRRTHICGGSPKRVKIDGAIINLVSRC